MGILEDVEKILHSEISGNVGEGPLDPDEDLLVRGIIDSLGIIRLTVSLEKTFDIKIADEDLVPENFQSLNALVKFVEQKLQNK
jgi:acyl carrier protein